MDGRRIYSFWTAPKYKEEMNRAVQYVVYRFDAKEKVNIDDPSHIVAITRDNFYKLPYEDGKTKVPLCGDSLGPSA